MSSARQSRLDPDKYNQMLPFFGDTIVLYFQKKLRDSNFRVKIYMIPS